MSTGGLLMVEPGLARWPDGEPYQVIVRCDEAGNAVGLLLDEHGNALVFVDDGDTIEEWTVDTAPAVIAEAATRLLFGHRG